MTCDQVRLAHWLNAQSPYWRYQHYLELNTQIIERLRLLDVYAALEGELQAGTQSGQQANRHLSQMLEEVQGSVNMTHTSFNWR